MFLESSGNPLMRPALDAAAEPVSLVSFEVSDEPMFEASFEEMPPADRARVLEIGARIIDGEDAAGFVPELEALVERHPAVAVIRNYLMCGVQAAGDMERFHAVLDETVRLFPRYTFAFASKVRTLVQNGRLDEAEAMLTRGPRGLMWLPTQFDPTRAVFHTSEVIAFAATLAEYLAARGELEAAGQFYQMAYAADPEHAEIERIEIAMMRAALKDAAGRLGEKRKKRDGGGRGKG